MGYFGFYLACDRFSQAFLEIIFVKGWNLAENQNYRTFVREKSQKTVLPQNSSSKEISENCVAIKILRSVADGARADF